MRNEDEEIACVIQQCGREDGTAVVYTAASQSDVEAVVCTVASQSDAAAVEVDVACGHERESKTTVHSSQEDGEHNIVDMAPHGGIELARNKAASHKGFGRPGPLQT